MHKGLFVKEAEAQKLAEEIGAFPGVTASVITVRKSFCVDIRYDGQELGGLLIASRKDWEIYGGRIRGEPEPDYGRDPVDPFEYATAHVGTFSNLLGMGHVDMCQRRAKGRGIDPADVLRLVVEKDGAEMTPPPPVGSRPEEVRIEKRSDEMATVVGPIWTEAGLSSLEMVFRVVPGELPEFGEVDFFIDHLRTRAGEVVLNSDPNAPPADWANAPIAMLVDEGHGGDPRIRKSAFVGGSYGVLIGVLENGMRRAVGDPQDHLNRLTPGQRAVFVLNRVFSQIYGDGFTSIYMEYAAGDLVPEVPGALRRVGASSFVELFERANALIPPALFSDRMARTDFVYDELGEDQEDGGQLSALERELWPKGDDTITLWEPIMSYINEHPDEFFCDV